MITSDSPWKNELKSLHREISDLRAEYESLRKKSIASRQSRNPSESRDFPILVQGMVADELRRRSSLIRLERRISALEKRIAELEALQRSELLN